jgi:hypothetical protein
MARKVSFNQIAPEYDSSQDTRPCMRNQSETIGLRSRLLSRSDQLLIRLLCQGHCTYAELAALQHISESSLRFRIRRLKRILGRQFSSFFQSPSVLSDDHQINRLVLKDQKSVKAISRLTGLSMYRTRKLLSRFKLHNRFKSASGNLSSLAKAGRNLSS